MSATEKVDKSRLPCQVFILDFYIDNPKQKLIRLAVEEANKEYRVVQWLVKDVGKEQEVSKQVKFVCDHAWEADEKLSELSTCLELERWECINEEAFTVYDVNKAFDERFTLGCECLGVNDYLIRRGSEGLCKIRQVPKGLFCVMTVDPEGNVRLKVRGCKDVFAPPSVRIVYDSIIRQKGSKGFAAEGVFDGGRFYMTDVLFVHDTWVNSFEFDNRELQWLAYVSARSVVNTHMLKKHTIKKTALSGILNDTVCAVMVYDEKGRVAIADATPKKVSVGGEKNALLYDDSFKKLGVMRKVGGVDLSYKTFNCLYLNTGSLGLEGVFF
jgi:hypothetical protein